MQRRNGRSSDGEAGGVRVGVVGCGYWGAKHVRVLHGLPEVSYLAAIDKSPQRRAEVEASFPGVDVFSSIDEALDLVDAVVVATPPASHAAIASIVLRQGRHALVEKPFAMKVEDARALVALAAGTGLTLMAGHTFQYNAAVEALRDVIAIGTLGDVLYVDTARLNLGLYQSDCNVIWDLAPHDISILNYLLRATPISVDASAAAHAHAQIEDVAYLQLTYPGLPSRSGPSTNVHAHIHVSWLDPCKVRRVTVVGSSQMAVYNDLADEGRLRIYDKGIHAVDAQPMHDAPVSYRYGSIVSPYVAIQEPLVVMDRHFLKCITDGSRPNSDGASGLAVVEALAAAERSLREGRRVYLDEVAPDMVDLTSRVARPTSVERHRPARLELSSLAKHELVANGSGAERNGDSVS